MVGKEFKIVENESTGTYMKREYIGFDGQFSILSAIGKTTLRAEGMFGQQPGIAGSSKSPNYSARPGNTPENALYKRPFLGYFFYLVQDIGTSPFSAVLKYDTYDPNTDIKNNEVGFAGSQTNKTDLAQSTIGIGALYRFSKNIRLQAYYELNSNEKSTNVSGYETDRKDNVLTVRLQYKF
jgi:opacity protein-like surface antigen